MALIFFNITYFPTINNQLKQKLFNYPFCVLTTPFSPQITRLFNDTNLLHSSIIIIIPFEIQNMEKAEPTGSLHEIEEEDFYGLGLDHNLLNTPLQSSNSPSLSSKNYVIK